MLQVLKWEYLPGMRFPLPILKDDREALNPQFVSQIQQWLLAKQDEFEKQEPTPQLVSANKRVRYLNAQNPRGGNRYKFQPTEKLRYSTNAKVAFEAGTQRITLKDKRGSIPLLHYDYLVAREVSTGVVIVGPLLRYKQLFRIP